MEPLRRGTKKHSTEGSVCPRAIPKEANSLPNFVRFML